MGKLKVAADTGALVSITLGGMLNVCTKHFDINYREKNKIGA